MDKECVCVCLLFLLGPIMNPAICGTTPAVEGADGIASGNDVNHGKWPWIGSLRRKDDVYDHHCSVVLIASEWALTAAHCLQNPTYDNKSF